MWRQYAHSAFCRVQSRTYPKKTEGTRSTHADGRRTSPAYKSGMCACSLVSETLGTRRAPSSHLAAVARQEASKCVPTRRETILAVCHQPERTTPAVRGNHTQKNDRSRVERMQFGTWKARAPRTAQRVGAGNGPTPSHLASRSTKECMQVHVLGAPKYPSSTTKCSTS